MSELQAGMLAMIIGCTRTPVNIGKIVTLNRVVSKGEKHCQATYDGDEQSWLVEGDGVIATNVLGDEYEFGFTYVGSKHLMPIPPLADPLDVTHKEELHA
jgi:hypothetical protein